MRYGHIKFDERAPYYITEGYSHHWYMALGPLYMKVYTDWPRIEITLRIGGVF